MTTMSTSLLNLSGSPMKNSKKISRTPNLTPNRDYDNSRSMTYRSNSNFIDLFNSPNTSTIKKNDNNLHERLYLQAKELKEKIDLKQNEFVEKIKRQSVPKILKISKKIERKQDLFPERLYPYHKLNKLDTEEDNSFEYAHVATVRSNPLGMSKEFDNDDFRNNIDSIFCDDEEIKNLYGNKPSYVKIYRGIKHPKKEKFSFKPTLSKNTCKIIKKLEGSDSSLLSIKKSKSNNIKNKFFGRNSYEVTDSFRDCSNNNKSQNINNSIENNFAAYSNNFERPSYQGRNSEGAISYNFERDNSVNSSNKILGADSRIDPNNNLRRNSINTINESNCKLTDFINPNNNENRINISLNNNINNKSNNTSNFNNSINLNNNFYNLYSQKERESKNINNSNKIINNINENQTNIKKNKKANPNYFDKPSTESQKTTYVMNIKKSYTSNYKNLTNNKDEKMSQNSINNLNKIYPQRKNNEYIHKIDSEINKNFGTKVNMNSTNATGIANSNYNTSNLLNINTVNSNANYPSDNFVVITQKRNIDQSNNKYNNLNLSENGNKNHSNTKSNLKSNYNSKQSNLTQVTTHSSKIQNPKGKPKSGAYSKSKEDKLVNVNYDSTNSKLNFMPKNSGNITNFYETNISKNNSNIHYSTNISNTITNKNINNFHFSCEDYGTRNQNPLINTSLKKINYGLFQTPVDKTVSPAKASSITKLTEKNNQIKLSNSLKTGFSIEKSNNQEKTKDDLKKINNSSKLNSTKTKKNIFQEKFSKNEILQNNDYVSKMTQSLSNKEQNKNQQNKIFCENIKNSKNQSVQNQEVNLSHLVSKKMKDNLNKAKLLNRADSMKNIRGNLHTNIFFNQAVFEIEENIDNNLNNHEKQVNLNINKNNIKPDSRQLMNKNMNINFNVNIMMNK